MKKVIFCLLVLGVLVIAGCSSTQVEETEESSIVQPNVSYVMPALQNYS